MKKMLLVLSRMYAILLFLSQILSSIVASSLMNGSIRGGSSTAPTISECHMARGEEDSPTSTNITTTIDTPSAIHFLSDGLMRNLRKVHRYQQLAQTTREFFSNPSSSEHISLQLRDEIRSLLSDTEENSSFFQFLTQTRRQLHKFPELMYQESMTSQTISSILQELNITHTQGWGINTRSSIIPGPGGYGIVAHIGTGRPPCILLRADMDALPITENGIEHASAEQFISQHVGTMHACGHDGHSTMLLGAAMILKSIEHDIPGTIRLMFQPAEEGGAGGKRMVEEGVVTLDPPAQHAFGLHVWPTATSGSILSRPGTLLAASDRFEIQVLGKGGHAAIPHLTIDPITTSAAMVMNLQHLVSRKLSPLQSGVVSISVFNSKGGDNGAFNVIPPSVLIRGTIRALDEETLLYLKQGVEKTVRSTALMNDCTVEIEWSPDFYPPTHNNPILFETFSRSVGDLVSDDGKLQDVEPTMGAEDFGFLSRTIPSTFFLLGQGGRGEKSSNDTIEKTIQTNYGLHDPRFTLDEKNMAKGVELHVNIALRALKMLANKESQ